MTTPKARWTEEDMIRAACGRWGEGFEPGDCYVIAGWRGQEQCLVVWHRPTDRISDEAGDAGRWRFDMTAFGE